MPRLCEAIEDFLNLVIDHWDDVFSLKGKALREKLYELYDGETHPEVSTGNYTPQQLENLIELHKKAFKGNYVKNTKWFLELYSGNADMPDDNAEPYRVYVNASSRNVIVLARILVELCRKHSSIVYFKIIKDPKVADRITDAIVVYLFGKVTARVVAIELKGITSDTLTPTVPAMTQWIAPGISIASELGGDVGLSFGQLVTSPFALAIEVYRTTFIEGGLLDHASPEACTEVFRLLLAGAFRAHGLNPLAPFASNGGYVKRSIKVADTIGAAEMSLAKRRAARG